MAKKIPRIQMQELNLENSFQRFISSKMANGIQEKTAKTYSDQFRAISKFMDVSIPFSKMTQQDIDDCIVAMRQSDLSYNSVASYARMLRTYMNWCNEQGLTNLIVPKIKDREMPKETYTDTELMQLLVKPKKNCSFSEYRNWVIVNLLLNSGCRAATIRAIKNKDVDIDSHRIVCRHTKNGKLLIIPLCSKMIHILREYTTIRAGEPDDYLFCNAYGEMLTDNALRNTIAHYNRKRGVNNVSLHSFRHTFAKKFIVDCHGDAFTLQKLLGHSTLVMTKRYCRIYDTEIVQAYDSISPLEQLSKPKRIKKHI